MVKAKLWKDFDSTFIHALNSRQKYPILRKNYVLNLGHLLNQKGHFAMRTVKPEEDSTVVFPSPMTAGATTTCSWFQTYCQGQGCIDRSNPCKGRCWSQTAPILCGNNLCLSKYQLEVKPVFSRSMRRTCFATQAVFAVFLQN